MRWVKNSTDQIFRLKAKNGEIIATGEGYKSKASCLNGIESIRKNSDSDIVEEKQALLRSPTETVLNSGDLSPEFFRAILKHRLETQ